MRKRKLTTLLMGILCLTFVGGGMAGCKHEHTYSDEWTRTETEHYHAATCEHTDEKKDSGTHTYGEWVTVKAPTETEKGKKQKKCTVCEYAVEEDIPALEHEHTFATEWSKDETSHWHAATCEHTDEKKDFAAHTFGEWVTVKEPTEDEDGVKQRECSVCRYAEEDYITATGHEHTFATEWSKDETGHWYAATCAHKNEKKDFAAHTYGEWQVVKEETTEETGLKKRVCSECDYEQTEVIPKHVHTFDTTDWVNDATGHWHPATCKHTTEKGDFAAHDYGEWVVDKEETTEETGLKHRICGTCQYRQEEVIPKHEHTFSAEWTKDETNHWHAATCKHTNEKKDVAAHTFGEWEIAVAVDDNIDGLEKRKCTVCEYEEQRVIKADPTPEEDKDAQLTKFRFEAEKAVLGNSRNTDHFCTGDSLEFSPSLSGNFAVCNIDTSTITFTFTSDKAVRSKLYIRMSSQYSQNTQGELSKYADITINGKHFVDLTQKFDPSTGEVAEGSSSSYFTMVTLETKISLKQGENVIVITPATANYLNLDYIEIDTSATLEDKTDSTLKSADFINVTAPTESATGKLSFNCNHKSEDDQPCGNQSKRGRDLPVVSHKVYTRTDTADKATYTVDILGTQVEVASTSYKLTVQDGVTFHGGKTSDFVIPASQVELVYEEPDGQILKCWKEVDGAELGEVFVMPEKNITIVPVFIEAVPATVTLQGATLNGSASVSTYVGKKIDLSKAEIENKPEGTVLYYWYNVNNPREFFTEATSFTVPSENITLAPAFDKEVYANKNGSTAGKVSTFPRNGYSETTASGGYIRSQADNGVKANDQSAYWGIVGDEMGAVYHWKTAEGKDNLDRFYFTPLSPYKVVASNTYTIKTTIKNNGNEEIKLKLYQTNSGSTPKPSATASEEFTLAVGEVKTISITFTNFKNDNILTTVELLTAGLTELQVGMYQYIEFVTAN